MSQLSHGFVLFGLSLSVLLVFTNRERSVRSKRSNLNFDDDEVPEISADSLLFFSDWTKEKASTEYIIANWKGLKKKFHTYRCIQSMSYLTPRAQKLDAYAKILEHIKKAKPIKVADVGCCFGQDTRQLILHGVPRSGIYAIDLHDGYWKAGIGLFRDENSGRLDDVKTFFCDMTTPLNHPESIEARCPATVASFDFIILQAVLHTIGLEQQQAALTRLRYLLKPGGILLGSCVGSNPAQPWMLTPDGKNQRYLNNEVSLTKTLTESGFCDIIVRDRDMQTQLALTSKSPRPSITELEGKLYLQFSAAR